MEMRRLQPDQYRLLKIWWRVLPIPCKPSHDPNLLPLQEDQDKLYPTLLQKGHSILRLLRLILFHPFQHPDSEILLKTTLKRNVSYTPKCGAPSFLTLEPATKTIQSLSGNWNYLLELWHGAESARTLEPCNLERLHRLPPHPASALASFRNSPTSNPPALNRTCKPSFLAGQHRK